MRLKPSNNHMHRSRTSIRFGVSGESYYQSLLPSGKLDQPSALTVQGSVSACRLGIQEPKMKCISNW
jgi:hypothetical protein